MRDLRSLKIGVVPGINDDPKPADFEGNGRGPNGAYFTLRYNNLVDAISEGVPSFSLFELLGQTEPYRYEVGVPILLFPGNLTFSWAVESEDNVATVDLYLNDQKINADPLGTSEGSYSYQVQDTLQSPNYRNTPGSVAWRLQGESVFGNSFEKTILARWGYKVIVGTSRRGDLQSYTDPQFNHLDSESALFRPIEVTKPATSRAEFLYVFLPIVLEGAYQPYTSWNINSMNTFDLPNFTTSINRYGQLIPYRVYRMPYATHGSFTLYLN